MYLNAGQQKSGHFTKGFGLQLSIHRLTKPRNSANSTSGANQIVKSELCFNTAFCLVLYYVLSQCEVFTLSTLLCSVPMSGPFACLYCNDFRMFMTSPSTLIRTVATHNVPQIRLFNKIGDDSQLAGNASDWWEAKATGGEIFASEQHERLVGSKI